MYTYGLHGPVSHRKMQTELEKDLDIPATVHVGTDAPLLFQFCLALYGITLGFTHTPAAFYIGEVVDDFEEPAGKDAANGIWNSMWEFGGSIGFLCGGAFAHNAGSYVAEANVLLALGIVCFMASGLLLWMRRDLQAP